MLILGLGIFLILFVLVTLFKDFIKPKKTKGRFYVKPEKDVDLEKNIKEDEMSTPARTYFCRNGHVVRHFNHGDWFEEDECPKNCCSVCDSTEIESVTEWGDLDYSSSEDVPTKPINYEQQLLMNVSRKTIREIPSLPVYDVSKLFGKSENEKE